MIIHTDSVRYIWEVLENNEYSFLFDKLRVIDLGCNVGAFSLWIYPHAQTIWAVDCEQSHIDNLNKTIKDNQMKSVYAIKDKVTDLAGFMSGHSIGKVDVLKVDIEGDEYELFGREDFPTDLVSTIIGEYHRDSLQERLTELGYRYIDLPSNHFIARR